MTHCCGAGRLREHSTPGTVRAQHRKVEASTGLEARLSEHGKGSPGVPQGKWLLAGPRRGAGAACGAEGRCAVPGRARRGGQVLARPLLLARPGAGDAPSRAPVPRSRCTLPTARPAGRRDPGAGRRPGPAPPCRATGGDWCRQGVRHPRSARAGSRDRGGGGRGGALSAAAPPPALRGRPSGRLGSALAREPAWGPGPPALTYRLPPDPCPPLRRTRRSNMAARGAPEAVVLPLPVPFRGPRSRPQSRSPFGHAPALRPSRPRPDVTTATAARAIPGRQGAPRAEAARAEAAPSPGNGVGVGAMSGGAGRRRRLVLHVDLNNTVVVADTVTGQAPRAALNTFLSTVTWGRAGAAGERRGRGYGGPVWRCGG